MKHCLVFYLFLATREGMKKGYKQVVLRTIGKEEELYKALYEMNALSGSPFM